MKKAILIIVTGDVQGVSYRYWAKKEAEKLGLSGWAKNEHDGTVSVFVQGPEDSLKNYLEWTKEGSPLATVEGVETKDSAVDENINRFEVK